MGYDYEDAWNDLKAMSQELMPYEESKTPFGNQARKWVRNKMLDIEKNITKK